MKNKRQSFAISKSQRVKSKKSWYKDKVDKFDKHPQVIIDSTGKTYYQRMKTNYDLFNNILDTEDLKHVCKVFGDDDKSPVKMENKDISSPKIKAFVGMESKRPFPYKILATNPEATTRREQEEFGQLKQFVINQIMAPIREEIEMRQFQSLEGTEPTQEDIQEIQQKIEEELATRTPEEVKKYMKREYQDPAEIMSQHLLNYLTQKLNLKKKFNECFKHVALAAREVMYVGIFQNEPQALVINNLRFNHDMSPDLLTIEDGEWATYRYKFTPSDIISHFPDLTEEEIIEVYESASNFNVDEDGDLFSVDELQKDYDGRRYIEVFHAVWKHPRKVGFLTYIGESGERQEMLVDESYKLNKDFGDIAIEWEYPPEVHEAWKIKLSKPIYKRMGPVPGQFKDLDNLYTSKLPYYGIYFDNMNSVPTSPMDRLRPYQYYYNTIAYRKEKLIAADKGKRVLLNINTVPSEMGMKKWQKAAEETPYMWFDPNEEGSGYNDVNTMAKVLDLSLASNIQSYTEMEEAIRFQAGRSVGIPDQVEGQIAPGEAVRNTQQNLIQTSYLLDPYYELHNHFKANVCTALIETAKIAYSGMKQKKVMYMLGDMDVELMTLDIGLLENSTLGLFVSDSGEVQRIKDTIEQLAHAAMQNQKAELSDVVAVLRQDTILEAEETLRVAEDNRREADGMAQREQQQAMAEEAEKAREFLREQHEMEKEKIILKEEERRQTEIVKASLLGASFNPDLDKDRDGENDFLEIARKGIETQIKQTKAQLEREEFEHKKLVDGEKLRQADKKLKNEEKKIATSGRNTTNKN